MANRYSSMTTAIDIEYKKREVSYDINAPSDSNNAPSGVPANAGVLIALRPSTSLVAADHSGGGAGSS
jgi:hypothetical protein